MWGRFLLFLRCFLCVGALIASTAVAQDDQDPQVQALFAAFTSGDIEKLRVEVETIELQMAGGGGLAGQSRTATYYLLGSLMFSRGDVEETERLYRLSADEAQSEGLWDSFEGFEVRYQLASALQLQKKHAEALQIALLLKTDLENAGEIRGKTGRDVLIMIGAAYIDLKFWPLAERVLRDVLTYAQFANPPDLSHARTASHGVAEALRGQERYEEAVPFARRNVEIVDQLYDRFSEDNIRARFHLGITLGLAVHLSAAKGILEEAIADLEKSGLDLPKLDVEARRVLAQVAEAEGRYLDSRSLRQDVIDGIQTTGSLVQKLNGMEEAAKNILVQGDYQGFVDRMGEIAEFVQENPDLPQKNGAMARVRQIEIHSAINNDFSMAAEHLGPAIEILENELGPDHPDTLHAKSALIKLRRTEAKLARSYQEAGIPLHLNDGARPNTQYSDEDLAVLKAFAAAKTASGYPWEGFMESVNYANALIDVGRFSEAHTVLDKQEDFVARPQQAGVQLALPFNFMVKESRGRLFIESGEFDKAVTSFDDGVDELLDLLREMRWAAAFADTQVFDKYGQLFGSFAVTAAWHADLLAMEGDYFARAFEAIQMAGYGPASSAVSRGSVRSSTDEGDLKRLVSELEALTDFRPVSGIEENAEDRRAREAKISFIHTEIDLRYPEYFGLQIPNTVPLADIIGNAETPALLAEDEALIVILPILDIMESKYGISGLIMAVTKEGTAWAELPSFRDMAQDITILHHHLDPRDQRLPDVLALRAPLEELSAQSDRPENSTEPVYAFNRAARLYDAFFGDKDVEALISDKPNWTIVPFGAALSAPFAALVTDDPGEGQNRSPADLRKVSWLGHERALTIVPSLNALKSLRTRELQAQQTDIAYLGIGDPVFQGTENAALPAVDDIIAMRGTSRAQGLASLPRLPGTRREVNALADYFGVGSDTVALGAGATEEFVKSMDESGELSRVRIVHFATHGLLSGAFAGLSEPALALSPPAEGTSGTDGLLTASEAAQLDLNAEWVILSACDTAGNEGIFGDGIGGLAQGFFNAGAQSLLISQWRVDDRAAEMLTTGAVTLSENGASKAEALRQTMIALAADSSRDGAKISNAHPSMWAPFVVVGGR